LLHNAKGAGERGGPKKDEPPCLSRKGTAFYKRGKQYYFQGRSAKVGKVRKTAEQIDCQRCKKTVIGQGSHSKRCHQKGGESGRECELGRSFLPTGEKWAHHPERIYS